MSRLYEITYNEEQWSCKGSKETGYKLVNKSTYDSYSINGDVIGIEQINDNSFLVYRRIMRDTWKILRLELIDGNTSCTFEQDLKDFCFLTEDTILFDATCVYSISKNCKVPEFDWISGKDLNIITVNSRKIIHVRKKVNLLGAPEYVQVFVDAETFKPITPASSTLRDNHHIILSDSYTFNDLVAEDEKYANIIHWYNFELSQECLKAGKQALLAELNATN